MKSLLTFILLSAVFLSCTTKTTKKDAKSIIGTWQLATGTIIEKGDTTVTAYSKDKSFIKIINETHFAFLQHDLTKGEDSTTASFVAGGGKYTLVDSTYTEHLEYCSARQWEGNDFSFTVTFKGDTLIQHGVEKVDSAGINRINIEKYSRVK